MSIMNIIALSDVHLRSTNPIARKDNIVKTQFKKLKFIFDYAQEHDCIILQAGDFLDKSRDWDLLVMLMKFFATYPDVRFHCILGQHDSYFYSSTRSTTLGVLEHMAIISILGKVPYSTGGFNIFGSSWGESVPEPAGPEYNILVTHRSIADTKIYPGQGYTLPGKFLSDNRKYKLTIVGDIHRSFHIKYDNRVIVNTGPMLRAEANEYNINHHHPHFWHFQLSDEFDQKNKGKIQGQIIPIPSKLSDEVLSRSHISENKNDIDINELTNRLGKGFDNTANKIIFDNLFKDDTIRPKIMRHLTEIYENAKR